MNITHHQNDDIIQENIDNSDHFFNEDIPSESTTNNSQHAVPTDITIPETSGFDNFITIDWIDERRNKLKKSQYLNNGFNTISNHQATTATSTNFTFRRNFVVRFFKYIFYQKASTFLTLTFIALTIGCIAGFLQIFTESLVNWKTGRCTTNWLLNQSFCCSEFESTTKCIENGAWTNYSKFPIEFPIFVTLSILFGTLSAILVKYLAPLAAGSGISEIKVSVSGFLYNIDFFNLTTLIIKSVALPLAIASGLSIGKEGPSVHYATCCGFIIANFFLVNEKFSMLNFPELTEYMIAGSAGGVAVAFGSPIGGVIFALEDIATNTDYNISTLWKSYYVALISTTTLKIINPFQNGKIVQFEITYDRDWHLGEVPIFILLGVFGGIYGNVVTKLNVHFVSFRNKYLSGKFPLLNHKNYAIQEVIILTSITALISYFNEFLKLDMAEGMEILFHECATEDPSWNHELCNVGSSSNGKFIQLVLSLLFATVVRALLIVVSYGCKVPCGIFVPSMAVGATFGRFVSLLVEKFITGPGVITPGTYAFLGAAASLSGITHLTLAVVVIMFELTGAFFYIIPTMIVVAVTRMIFVSYGTHMGIAEQMIVFNGFPLLEEDIDNSIIDYKCMDILNPEKNLIYFPETVAFGQICAIVQEHSHDKIKEFPVVDNNNKCIGLVTKERLETFIFIKRGEDNTNDAEIINFKTTTMNYDSFTNNEVDEHDVLESSNQELLMNKLPVIAKNNSPLDLIHSIFQKVGPKNVIIEDEMGDFQGLISKKDLLRFERGRYREKHGPLYQFNHKWDECLWSFISKFTSK
ncbi:Gef1p SCDLUD_003394 [Saccharomycodes ludwigii]|uniref:Gef1p n=1 Tax=Saccharomycodes ludwigii TaxID=36035 RepID=UPI001E898EB6|nr:hypothetical protein SCDLUD_003394 [Saccharomycodes ludwigii]KAH3900415.1 hypothetical protein SCDLUD_003394 [Saccharomycodes ludwigii]